MWFASAIQVICIYHLYNSPEQLAHQYLSLLDAGYCIHRFKAPYPPPPILTNFISDLITLAVIFILVIAPSPYFTNIQSKGPTGIESGVKAVIRVNDGLTLHQVHRKWFSSSMSWSLLPQRSRAFEKQSRSELARLPEMGARGDVSIINNTMHCSLPR